MPERIVRRSRGFSPNLYFKVPFETKKRFGIKRGDTLRCTLKRIIDSQGNVIKNVNREVDCKVLLRDDHFYLAPQLVQELNLFGGEYYELILQKRITVDGKEVEICPGELVDRNKGRLIKE
jgi:hypothetical protein